MSSPPFEYLRPRDLAEAMRLGSMPQAAFVAGGTDLLQLWKSGVAAPAQVVDLSHLPLGGVDRSGNAMRIGAIARLSAVATDPGIVAEFPLITQAIMASASGQIRNMATVGGNLLQRTRCPYFRTEGQPSCNKRTPGSGCGAKAGDSRSAAIFGASESCVATHASDLAVALSALDGMICTDGPVGARSLTLETFYSPVEEGAERETALAPGEIITHVEVTNASAFRLRSAYLKVRNRASFDFAVVSVAAALIVEGGVIQAARIACGGVAPRPWRLRACELALVGRAPSAQAFADSALLASEGARALRDNGFKIRLLEHGVARALNMANGELLP